MSRETRNEESRNIRSNSVISWHYCLRYIVSFIIVFQLWIKLKCLWEHYHIQNNNYNEAMNYHGFNENGKRVLYPGSTEEEVRYERSLRRKVDTSEYSIDVLIGKMSRLSINDRAGAEEVIVLHDSAIESGESEDDFEDGEVIVLNGNYIVCGN